MASQSAKSEEDVFIYDLLRKLKKAKDAYDLALANARLNGALIIRESRRSLGLNQEEFGRLVDRHPIHISKLENGGMHPGLHLLLHLLEMHAAKRSAKP
jgi:DNA-binding XRE family transcriptional regulator